MLRVSFEEADVLRRAGVNVFMDWVPLFNDCRSPRYLVTGDNIWKELEYWKSYPAGETMRFYIEETDN